MISSLHGKPPEGREEQLAASVTWSGIREKVEGWADQDLSYVEAEVSHLLGSDSEFEETSKGRRPDSLGKSNSHSAEKVWQNLILEKEPEEKLTGSKSSVPLRGTAVPQQQDRETQGVHDAEKRWGLLVCSQDPQPSCIPRNQREGSTACQLDSGWINKYSRSGSMASEIPGKVLSALLSWGGQGTHRKESGAGSLSSIATRETNDPSTQSSNLSQTNMSPSNSVVNEEVASDLDSPGTSDTEKLIDALASAISCLNDKKLECITSDGERGHQSLESGDAGNLRGRSGDVQRLLKSSEPGQSPRPTKSKQRNEAARKSPLKGFEGPDKVFFEQQAQIQNALAVMERSVSIADFSSFDEEGSSLWRTTTKTKPAARLGPDCCGLSGYLDFGRKGPPDSTSKAVDRESGLGNAFGSLRNPGNAARLLQNSEHTTNSGALLEGSTSPDSLPLEFFKVYPCYNESQLHDRKECPFYHSHRDRRRYPVFYQAEQCENHFDLDDFVCTCPKGEECEKCHNRHELLYHPDIYKQRFCSSYNQLKCHRGKFCAFAHARSEIRCCLFSFEVEKNPTPEFFMMEFKTLWCPYGVQHDWHGCLYAHTYQDCRRSPYIGYGSEPCPYWQKDLHSADYHKRCPFGPSCSFSHGSKEQLYHPTYYKLMPCVDYKARRSCPRGKLCAFYHDMSERRVFTPKPSQFQMPINEYRLLDPVRKRNARLLKSGSSPLASVGLLGTYDYSSPIPESYMNLLQPNFMKPPLFNLDDFESFGHASKADPTKLFPFPHPSTPTRVSPVNRTICSPMKAQQPSTGAAEKYSIFRRVNERFTNKAISNTVCFPISQKDAAHPFAFTESYSVGTSDSIYGTSPHHANSLSNISSRSTRIIP